MMKSGSENEVDSLSIMSSHFIPQEQESGLRLPTPTISVQLQPHAAWDDALRLGTSFSLHGDFSEKLF